MSSTRGTGRVAVNNAAHITQQTPPVPPPKPPRTRKRHGEQHGANGKPARPAKPASLRLTVPTTPRQLPDHTKPDMVVTVVDDETGNNAGNDAGNAVPKTPSGDLPEWIPPPPQTPTGTPTTSPPAMLPPPPSAAPELAFPDSPEDSETTRELTDLTESTCAECLSLASDDATEPLPAVPQPGALDLPVTMRSSHRSMRLHVDGRAISYKGWKRKTKGSARDPFKPIFEAMAVRQFMGRPRLTLHRDAADNTIAPNATVRIHLRTGDMELVAPTMACLSKDRRYAIGFVPDGGSKSTRALQPSCRGNHLCLWDLTDAVSPRADTLAGMDNTTLAVIQSDKDGCAHILPRHIFPVAIKQVQHLALTVPAEPCAGENLGGAEGLIEGTEPVRVYVDDGRAIHRFILGQ